MSLNQGLTRIATAVIGIPVVVGAAYVGGWTFVVLVAGSTLLAQYELYGLIARGDGPPLVVPGLVLGAVVCVRTAMPSAVGLAVGLTIALTIYVFLSERFDDPWQTASSTLTGVVYPTLLLSYLVDLRLGAAATLGDQEAFGLTMVVLGLVWVSDTAAYYVGKSLGRHSLAPTISPKKTWEGTVGGAVGSLGVALALWNAGFLSLGWLDFAVLGIFCGSLGQLGDLAESRLKRLAGVKDSASVLPGHGGLLDRLDAMTVAVPLSVLYLRYVAGVL